MNKLKSISIVKRASVTVLAFVFILALVPAGMTQAKKPLIGEMYLQFNLAWPGPSKDIPDWVGTITIDDVEYGMAFFAYGSGKPFEEDPNNKIHFFAEIWTIYVEWDFEFDADGNLVKFETGDIALNGTDEGITTLKNSKYHMTGKVTDTNEYFGDKLGRNVYMRGTIEWYPFGAPKYAPGIFRIN